MSATPKLKLDLHHVRVRDVMRQTVISVAPGTPMSTVAELMAAEHIHAVAIGEPGQRGESKIVSALDLVAAATAGTDPPIEHIPARTALTVSAGASVQDAAHLMAERGQSHLIVADPASGRPTGVLSTLDVVAALAA
ncbi:MAG TPA: CBS domain-containing protein [Solirubrobacteraceae bacterium]|nr:CBS domain-containing protein [Solirubrobacteraceae bacterium]